MTTSKMIEKIALLLIVLPYFCVHPNLSNSQIVLAEDFKINPEPQNEKLSLDDEQKLREFLKSMNERDVDTTKIKDVGAYCQSLRTCIECVKSLWYPCSWCHNYGCTHKAETLCPYAAFNYEKSTGEGYNCPSIKHQGHLLISAGVKANLRVKLTSVDPVIYDKEILCQLKLKDKLIHVKGLILNDIVYCYPLVIDTTSVSESETGSFRLIWGGVDPFSNDIPFVVYRCEMLASDCESCRMLPADYQCGWCEVMNSCVIGEKCVNDFMKWTLSRITCQPYGKKLYYV